MEANEIDKLRTYVCSDGTVLRLESVREVVIQKKQAEEEERFRKLGRKIDTPTRRIVALGGKGDVEEVPLTADTLVVRDNDEQTARNRALWAEHEQALLDLAQAKQETRTRVMLALGVNVEVPPVEEWAGKLEYAEVPMPEHPLDQKAAWLTYVKLDDFDRVSVLSQLQILVAGKAVKPEQVEAFQGAVRAEMEEAVAQLVRSATERVERARDRMAGGDAVRGDEGGEGVGRAA